MSNSRKIGFWRTAFLAGGAVLVVGLGSMYADYAFRSGVDAIDEHFGVVLFASMAGMLLCTISLVGWARQLQSGGRAKVGAFASLMSVVICVSGATVGGTNVHGPLILLCLPILPVFVVGLLVWLSATFSRN
jgi:hypothetical protein